MSHLPTSNEPTRDWSTTPEPTLEVTEDRDPTRTLPADGAPRTAPTVEKEPAPDSKEEPAQSPAQPSGRATTYSRTDLLIAGVVGLVTAVIAWVFRSDIISTDPWHYVMAALGFPQHSWVPLGYTRYGMILPLGPLVLAFGTAPATFYAPALLASAVLAGSMYLLGTRFWGRVAGFTAVLLLLTNWIVFINLTRFYPDIPSIGLVMLALVLAVAARDRQVQGRRLADVLPVLVGFLLGWSFEARETALFAWPAVIAVLWVRGRVVRNAILAAIPVLLWAAVDVIISATAYGDPLLKLHTFTRQDLAATTNPADVAVLKDFVGLPRLDYVTMIPRLVLERDVPGGAWFLALGTLAVLALLIRNRAVRLVSGAFILSYVLFVGISGFFLPDHPAGRLDVQRYWIQFVPWIALAVAGALHVLVRDVWKGAKAHTRKVVHIALSAVVVAVPLAGVSIAASTSPTVATNGGAPLSGVSAALAARSLQPDTRVFTDWQTLRILPIYQRPAFGGAKLWPAELQSLTGKERPRPGDYVLLVRNDNDAPCGFCRTAAEPWRQANPQIPPSWERVYASENDGYVLYLVH